MKFLRLTWMPKAARFWPEENILNPALGAAAPWEIQISNQTIFKADEPPDSPGAQPQHVMDGVQQTPSPPTSSALVATFSRSRGREGPEQTGLGSSGFGSEAFAVTQQTLTGRLFHSTHCTGTVTVAFGRYSLTGQGNTVS